MSERRYTVCTYYPDLIRPDRAFDFAVIAATCDGLAMVGVNLTAYGLNDDNPFAQSIIEGTFDVMVRRVEDALEDTGFESYLDMLDRIVSVNQANIQFQPIVIEESEADLIDIGKKFLGKSGKLGFTDSFSFSIKKNRKN